MGVIRDVAQTVFSIKAQRDDAIENQDPFPIMDKERLEQNRMQKKIVVGPRKEWTLDDICCRLHNFQSHETTKLGF